MSLEELVNDLESSKMNLEELIDTLFSYRQDFFSRAPGRSVTQNHVDENTTKQDELERQLTTHEQQMELPYQDHPYYDLSTLINSVLPSFLAPAYHYNDYIKAVIQDIQWDEIKWVIAQEDWVSSALRRATYQTCAQSILLAVKMGLDRLVSIFSYYYKGFSAETTFGRYRPNGKPSGFMALVSQLKDSDGLMSYIDEEYFKWIRIAVDPRDTITHYNDLGITYYFDSTIQVEIPIHVNQRLLASKEVVSSSADYTFLDLYKFVTCWYIFFDSAIKMLLEKELIRQKPLI